MAEPKNTFELGRFLLGLAHNLTHHQARLDAHYAASLRAYRPVLQAARAAGHEELARELMPTPLVIERAELRAEVQLGRSETQEFSLSVRLLNIGFVRRHQYAGTESHTLELSVQRVPFPQGSPLSEFNPASPIK